VSPPKVQTEARTTEAPTSWTAVEKLVSEQKLEEASRLVAALRAAARSRRDAEDETKALVREVQLRMALHGYETAVRFLREEPWPKTPRAEAVLNLFYADALVTYARAYSWEIGQREKVETKGVVDLRAWTRDQITAEAARAFAAAWKEREALGRESVETLKEFVEPNDYPRSVRGTARDAGRVPLRRISSRTRAGGGPSSRARSSPSTGTRSSRGARRSPAPWRSTTRRPIRSSGSALSSTTTRHGTAGGGSARPSWRRGSSASAASATRSPTRRTARRSGRTSPPGWQRSGTWRGGPWGRPSWPR